MKELRGVGPESKAAPGMVPSRGCKGRWAVAGGGGGGEATTTCVPVGCTWRLGSRALARTVARAYGRNPDADLVTACVHSREVRCAGLGREGMQGQSSPGRQSDDDAHVHTASDRPEAGWPTLGSKGA